MAYELLLREGRINSMPLRNRIITGPMERSMANRDGSLNQTYVDYLAERARGGASLIMIESTYVDVRGLGHVFQVGCHGDHVIPGLKRAADAVHADGAKLGIELYMGGRETASSASQRQPIAPSVVPCERLNPPPVPREMTMSEIKEVIDAFAAASRRVVAAGLDMIHLHGAHGYLLGAFLSPFSNKRADGYGGTLENRARFALEVLAAVRNVVGAGFPIGYRMSAEEYVEGGLSAHDTARFAVMLAEAGIDLIDVSGAIYESFHLIIQGPEAPKGPFVNSAAIIKRAVGDRVPVSVGQRLNDPEFANEVMRREGFDFVTLSRAFHADPHYVKKLEEARPEDIIPCMACHQCTNMLEANLPTGCAANPSTGLERKRRITPVSTARRVLVVGGGPAGMHAARILALQGNDVAVYEQAEELGGQMRYSSRVAPDYGYLVDFLKGQLRKLKVDVRTGAVADATALNAERPDAVVLATGALGGLRFFPLIGQSQTFDLFAAFERPEEKWEGEKVVIAGGDSESCFLALYLARRGAEVDVVEPKSGFSSNKAAPGRDLLMTQVEKTPNIRLRAQTTVEGAGDGYVILQSLGRLEKVSRVHSVVVGGRVANNGLYEQLMETGTDFDVYKIGDSVVPHDVYTASQNAADVAELISLRSNQRHALAR